jgi:hypothetical protein
VTHTILHYVAAWLNGKCVGTDFDLGAPMDIQSMYEVVQYLEDIPID